MSIWSCPVCGENLLKREKSLVCKKNHSFDYARSGYVNLLPVSRKKTKLPGDNALMINARRSFLSRDFYKPMSDSLCNVVDTFMPYGGVLFDAGCGEGYYTKNVYQSLSDSDKNAEIYGVDISKYAADAAAKSCRTAKFAVGSVFHIPVIDNSCDVLMSLFAPYCGDEFRRVLKPNGKMILVIPGRRHLWGLKKAIYSAPYENNVQDYKLSGFEFLGTEKVDYEIILKSADDIQNLFTMTPYYYKTGIQEHMRLKSLSELSTEVSFEILKYRKKE
ncbi:MAG: methyltransferase domain-containing protein [Ruminococcus sp.]|nr:methyltransferase domain-containing protein [Ruminococcus sp.]